MVVPITQITYIIYTLSYTRHPLLKTVLRYTVFEGFELLQNSRKTWGALKNITNIWKLTQFLQRVNDMKNGGETNCSRCKET